MGEKKVDNHLRKRRSEEDEEDEEKGFFFTFPQERVGECAGAVHRPLSDAALRAVSRGLREPRLLLGLRLRLLPNGLRLLRNNYK